MGAGPRVYPTGSSLAGVRNDRQAEEEGLGKAWIGYLSDGEFT